MLKGVKVVHDHQRGCGWRDPMSEGALYMMAEGRGMICGRLPIPLDVCPCCGTGFKQSRGFTWIDAQKVFRFAIGETECPTAEQDEVCPLAATMQGFIEKMGLIWIGKKYYATPKIFMDELDQQGMSRRIPAVPNDFVVGETWVCLAHPNALLEPVKFGEKEKRGSAIVVITKPTEIQVVCTEETSQDQVDSWIERGLTPVMIKHVDDSPTQDILDLVDWSKIDGEE